MDNRWALYYNLSIELESILMKGETSLNRTTSAIYNILEWITKFAYVNLLWVLFTLLGGIVLGFYPATTAMFAMVRDWLRGKSDLPVFKSFWNYYKREFWKSNRLGIFITILFALIALDIYYIQANTSEQLVWTYIPLFAFMLLVVLYLFYIFPGFVHYDLKVLPLLKNTFLIMIISPIYSFWMIVCLVSMYFIMRAAPALFFIFGGTAYACITPWLGLHAFDRIQEKKKSMN